MKRNTLKFIISLYSPFIIPPKFMTLPLFPNTCSFYPQSSINIKRFFIRRSNITYSIRRAKSYLTFETCFYHSNIPSTIYLVAQLLLFDLELLRSSSNILVTFHLYVHNYFIHMPSFITHMHFLSILKPDLKPQREMQI